MSILVVVASRHGNTTDIAEAIVEELRSKCHIVDVRIIEGHPNRRRGSRGTDHRQRRLYMGSWFPHARQFVEHNLLELTKVPLWLFSIGPLGDHEPDASEPLQLDTASHTWSCDVPTGLHSWYRVGGRRSVQAGRNLR